MPYTKGDWKVTSYATKVKNYTAYIETDDECLAEVYGDTQKEAGANAQLIAAAPDLYETCKDALNAVIGNFVASDGVLANKLKAAIAKAGEVK